jgi:hypothetical protein
VYSVTVANIKVGATMSSYTYSVTVFDPAAPGPDYSAPAITGPSQPVVNADNAYSCTPVSNPQVTGYQWLVSRRTSGNLSDGAENGLANFTASTTPGYNVITNAVRASGHDSFYLAHPSPAAQLLQLNEVLFPGSNTLLSFESRLCAATTSEVARVQVSLTGGAAWQDVYTQPGAGTNSNGELGFSLRKLSLSNFAGQAILLRFDYDFVSPGSYFNTAIPGQSGWLIDDIAITNTEQVDGFVTNSTPSNAFVFNPAQGGDYNLEAQALIFGGFPAGWGPVAQVTAITNHQPVVVMSSPILTNGQLWLNFALTSGSPGPFKLQQAGQFPASWTTNTAAKLATNVAGKSYRFTLSPPPDTRFYRISAP